MAKNMCRHHPEVFASGVCKQCAIPICDECKTVRPQGIFCCEECADRFAAFQDRIAVHKGTGGGGLVSLLVKIAVLAAVLLVAYLFLHSSYGVDSPADLPGAIKSMISDLIGLFR
ncbi:hypothetical protein JW916_05645 [Candidatus Sumerlaeota bacterium]|nr:hypothetical protein [Candidatus Sumerlaeota bacterium]